MHMIATSVANTPALHVQGCESMPKPVLPHAQVISGDEIESKKKKAREERNVRIRIPITISEKERNPKTTIPIPEKIKQKKEHTIYKKNQRHKHRKHTHECKRMKQVRKQSKGDPANGEKENKAGPTEIGK